MFKRFSIAALAVAVSLMGAGGAFAQRGDSHGIWKPHYDSMRSGRSYSGGRAFNYYARPSYNYVRPQPTIAAEPTYRSFSFEPIGINPGDTVVVNRDNVRLMLGRTVVGEVPKGLEFKATKVINGWVGGVVEVNGQKLSGWIWNRNVEPADAAVAPPSGT